ncbi:MAG: hypothetical protein ACEPOW_12690 [Bacteroidales bacterium]
MLSDHKELIGFISVVLAASAYIEYIKSTINGKVSPHLFTWLIWTILTGIAYFGQISDNAGPGAWATGLSAVASGIITILALFQKKEYTITKSDWITFISSILAIPLWVLTKTPIYSIILITSIDLISFYPTIRKTWLYPEQESLFCFTLSGIKFFVALLALDKFSFITAFYISALVFANLGFVAYTIIVRKIKVPS